MQKHVRDLQEQVTSIDHMSFEAIGSVRTIRRTGKGLKMLKEIGTSKRMQRAECSVLRPCLVLAEIDCVRSLRLETPIDGNFDKRRHTATQRPRSFPKDNSSEISVKDDEKDARRVVSNH